jgi:hypothetical protein
MAGSLSISAHLPVSYRAETLGLTKVDMARLLVWAIIGYLSPEGASDDLKLKP